MTDDGGSAGHGESRTSRRRSGFGGRGRGTTRSSWGRPAPAPPVEADDGEEPQPPRGGTVTKITAQVRDTNRTSVFLDGEFAFGITTDRVLMLGIAPKDVLTAERVAELMAMDTVDRAIAAGMELLSYRQRSEAELRDRLARKGFVPVAIDAAVERLLGWGYLDDGEFARRWVENRIEHRPRGSRLIAQELRHKGIDRELIGETLEAADIDELAAALEAGRRKSASYARLDPAVARRRLGGFLARRGFSGGVVRQATDQLLDPDPDDDGMDDDEG